MASEPEPRYYRPIQGLEAAMPAPASQADRGTSLPSCCTFLLRCLGCLGSSSEDDYRDDRRRELEQHVHHYQYQAPSGPSSSGPVLQRPSAHCEEDTREDLGLLPKTAPSSAVVPRSGHSRSNSAASAAAAPGAEALSKRPSTSDALGPPETSKTQQHRRTHSLGEAKQRRHVKDTSDVGPGAAEGAGSAAGAGAGAVGAASAGQSPVVAGAGSEAGAGPHAGATAAGRPGTLYGPMQDEDDDFCPTCLDAYTTENPKIFTECGHHFHMPCIYAWLERKDTCPMCESPMQAPGM